jgi:hypothetical protein
MLNEIQFVAEKKKCAQYIKTKVEEEYKMFIFFFSIGIYKFKVSSSFSSKPSKGMSTGDAHVLNKRLFGIV